jgi:hypothetical protein
LPDEDQFTSRIGQVRKIKMTPNDGHEMSELLLDQYAPSFKRELAKQAFAVAMGRGHSRRLKKQLRLTLDMLEGGLDPKDEYIKQLRQGGRSEAQIAFDLAATQLLTVEEDER